MAAEQCGTEKVCKTRTIGSIPAVASKLRLIISKWRMRKFINYPGWVHLKSLPDNLTILRSSNPDWLAGLIEMEYYWPALRRDYHSSLRAALILKVMYSEEREKNIILSKENSKLKRNRQKGEAL